eukprot:scaffold146666_cov65-Attheya_sp.AAC.1
MAPNLKESSSVHEALSALDLSSFMASPITKSAYLPLTHPKADHSEIITQEKAPSHNDVDMITAPHVHTADGSDNYWDWQPEPTEDEKKQETIRLILAEEEARLAVSSSILLSLEVPTASQNAPMESISANGEYEEFEGYWDMDVENDVADEVVVAQHLRDDTHPLNAYWDWDTSPKTKDQQRNDMIQNILAEESIRSTLSVTHIEQGLKQSAAENSRTKLMTSNHEETDDDYWIMKEDLEETVVPHPAPLTHSSNHYWNWPSSAEPSSTEVKELFLRLILEEDNARKILSIQHVEKNLRHHSKVMNNHIAEDTSDELSTSYWMW